MRCPRRMRAACVVATLLATGAAEAFAQQGPQVPFVPTPHEVVRAMLEVARVDSTDVVYDLGSGDGRIVIAAATRHGASGLGVDIDAELVAVAMRNAQASRVHERVEFRQQDLFELDLSPATVVTLYLLSDINLRLRPRLLEQLRPGARVVSHAFDMRDWEPDSTLWVRHNGMHARVYYWVIPARVAGAWRFSLDDAAPVSLQLVQRFQRVQGAPPGEMRGPGDPPLQGRLRGEEIALSFRGDDDTTLQLVGRVTDGGMEGTVAGTGRRWSAQRLTD